MNHPHRQPRKPNGCSSWRTYIWGTSQNKSPWTTQRTHRTASQNMGANMHTGNHLERRQHRALKVSLKPHQPLMDSQDGHTEKPAPTPPEASNMPGVETGASAAMAPPSAHCYVVWKTDTTTDIRGIHTGGYAAWDFIRHHLPGQKYDKTARLKRCETLPAAFVLYASEQRRHDSPTSPRVWDH